MNILKCLFKMKPPSLFDYVSAIILLIFTVGVYKQLTQKTANNCEMTFMFEYPHFVVSYNIVINIFLLLAVCINFCYFIRKLQYL